MTEERRAMSNNDYDMADAYDEAEKEVSADAMDKWASENDDNDKK